MCQFVQNQLEISKADGPEWQTEIASSKKQSCFLLLRWLTRHYEVPNDTWTPSYSHFPHAEPKVQDTWIKKPIIKVLTFVHMPFEAYKVLSQILFHVSFGNKCERNHSSQIAHEEPKTERWSDLPKVTWGAYQPLFAFHFFLHISMALLCITGISTLKVPPRCCFKENLANGNLWQKTRGEEGRSGCFSSLSASSVIFDKWLHVLCALSSCQISALAAGIL